MTERALVDRLDETIDTVIARADATGALREVPSFAAACGVERAFPPWSHGSAKATTLSPRRVRIEECPPAATTTNWRPSARTR